MANDQEEKESMNLSHGCVLSLYNPTVATANFFFLLPLNSTQRIESGRRVHGYHNET